MKIGELQNALQNKEIERLEKVRRDKERRSN